MRRFHRRCWVHEPKLSHSVACHRIVIGVVHGQVVARHHDVGDVAGVQRSGCGGVVPGGRPGGQVTVGVVLN